MHSNISNAAGHAMGKDVICALRSFASCDSLNVNNFESSHPLGPCSNEVVCGLHLFNLEGYEIALTTYILSVLNYNLLTCELLRTSLLINAVVNVYT